MGGVAYKQPLKIFEKIFRLIPTSGIAMSYYYPLHVGSIRHTANGKKKTGKSIVRKTVKRNRSTSNKCIECNQIFYSKDQKETLSEFSVSSISSSSSSSNCGAECCSSNVRGVRTL